MHASIKKNDAHPINFFTVPVCPWPEDGTGSHQYCKKIAREVLFWGFLEIPRGKGDEKCKQTGTRHTTFRSTRHCQNSPSLDIVPQMQPRVRSREAAMEGFKNCVGKDSTKNPNPKRTTPHTTTHTTHSPHPQNLPTNQALSEQPQSRHRATNAATGPQP